MEVCANSILGTAESKPITLKGTTNNIVSVTGTFTLNNGIIDGENARRGVACVGGKFIMNGGKIINCYATYGAAVDINVEGSMEMTGGEISNNIDQNSGTLSQAYGGGIFVCDGGKLEMEGGTIHNNMASASYSFGGNVYLAANGREEDLELTTFIFRSGTISGDGTTKQAMIGSGVAIAKDAVFVMTGGTIEKCYSDIGAGVSNAGTATIKGGTIKDCVASNDASNAGKAIANNGTLYLGNVTLGSGQDIAMGYQKVTVAGIEESYGNLNVIETLTNTYTITFAQIVAEWIVNLKIDVGSKAISRYTSGTVFATYIDGVTADASKFTTSGYTFYVSNGNVYMQAA